ncbi:MAG: hypothetical protein H6739_20765 [Alphaproteobacteria bacterium]|nr:hypothetical protein [Alphaproteobacteria bacterium]
MEGTPRMVAIAWGLMTVVLAGCCKFGVWEEKTAYLSAEELDEVDNRFNDDNGVPPPYVCEVLCGDYVHITSDDCVYIRTADGGADVTCYYERYC